MREPEGFIEEIIDADNKIITSCPKCMSQNHLYLIRGSQLKGCWGDKTEVIDCDSCRTKYLVEVSTELKCYTRYFNCEEINHPHKMTDEKD